MEKKEFSDVFRVDLRRFRKGWKWLRESSGMRFERVCENIFNNGVNTSRWTFKFSIKDFEREGGGYII